MYGFLCKAEGNVLEMPSMTLMESTWLSPCGYSAHLQEHTRIKQLSALVLSLIFSDFLPQMDNCIRWIILRKMAQQHKTSRFHFVRILDFYSERKMKLSPMLQLPLSLAVPLTKFSDEVSRNTQQPLKHTPKHHTINF